MRLTLVGHMTVRIDLDGVSLLTDPWFGPHGWLERRLAPRTQPPALAADDLDGLDALLVSHDHLDHFDATALDLARGQGCAVIGPPSVTRRARQAGVARAIALRPGDETTLGEVCIHALPAEHPLAPDALGLVVAGSRTLCFSGDTRFTPALSAALRRFRLDVALVQAACAHYPLVGDDGMSLGTAADLARAVRPGWVVPLHLHCAGKWLDRRSGLRITGDNAAQVGESLARWAEALSADGLRARILVPGEPWEVEA